MGSSGQSKLDYNRVLGANLKIQTTVVQGIALVGPPHINLDAKFYFDWVLGTLSARCYSAWYLAGALDRQVAALEAQRAQTARSPSYYKRRLLQSSLTNGTVVDLGNSTAVADLLSEAISSLLAFGNITAATAATAQANAAVVAVAISNINSAVSILH